MLNETIYYTTYVGDKINSRSEFLSSTGASIFRRISSSVAFLNNRESKLRRTFVLSISCSYTPRTERYSKRALQ